MLINTNYETPHNLIVYLINNITVYKVFLTHVIGHDAFYLSTNIVRTCCTNVLYIITLFEEEQ